MLRPTQLTRDSDPVLIEIMRNLFAAGTSGYSREVFIPTAPEQQEWWKTLPHDKVKAFLWRDDERPWEIVAYSLITDCGTFASPVFAVAPMFQGRGYGDQIIKHYIATAGKPLRGQQLVSNGAIRKLNARNGWVVVRKSTALWTNPDIEYLEHPGPTTTFPDYDAILKGLDG